MRIRILVPVIMLAFAVHAFCHDDVWSKTIAPTGMLITGVGIGTVWTLDLIARKHINMNGSAFKARDKSTNQILWPHLLVEYGTAASAVISALGLYQGASWAPSATLVSSGLIAYTSVNSMSWVLSEKGRWAYAIPMAVGLAGAGIAVVTVF